MVSVSFPLLSVPIAIVLAYIPHFIRVAIITRAGKYDNANPRDYSSQYSSIPEKTAALATRLSSCHQNSLEMLGVYAAGIVACVAVNEDDTTLDILSALYLGFRASYVIAYAAPQFAAGLPRTLAFIGCSAILMTVWGKAAFV